MMQNYIPIEVIQNLYNQTHDPSLWQVLMRAYQFEFLDNEDVMVVERIAMEVSGGVRREANGGYATVH